MMRKRIGLLIIVFAVLLLSGCGMGDDRQQDALEFSVEDAYAVSVNENGTYGYTVKDANGNVFASVTDLNREPEMAIVSNTLLRVSVQAGTGISTRWTVYYDIENGQASEPFDSVLGEYEERTVYVGLQDGMFCIVTQDIFGSDDFCVAAVLEDVFVAADPVVEFEIRENGTARVVYLKGENYTETELLISLEE